jgi:hypothetical protein
MEQKSPEDFLDAAAISRAISEKAKSPEYKQAAEKAAEFSRRMEKANKKDAERIRAEARIFFSGLRSRNPEIFESFRMAAKGIEERASYIITGKKIIFD